MGKTNVLSTEQNEDTPPSSLQVEGHTVEVLRKDGATMYLGRLLSLSSIQEVELTHRLERDWKKFMMNKAQLCSKDFRLVDRLK